MRRRDFLKVLAGLAITAVSIFGLKELYDLTFVPKVEEDPLCRQKNSVRIGDFTLVNSAWGDPDSAHMQCLMIDPDGTFGWKWAKAHQSINPIWPHVRLDGPSFPINFSDVHSLKSRMWVVVNATGIYDLAFDIFGRDKSGIQHEFMIWLDYSTDKQIPANEIVGDDYNQYIYSTFPIQDVVYHEFDKITRELPDAEFEVDIEKLLRNTGFEGVLDSVAVGSEIRQGSGSVVFRELEIGLNEKSYTAFP